LRKLNGDKITASASHKKIKLLEKRRTLLCEKK